MQVTATRTSPDGNVTSNIYVTTFGSVSSSEFQAGQYSVTTYASGVDPFTQYFNTFVPDVHLQGATFADGTYLVGSAGRGSYLNLSVSGQSAPAYLTNVYVRYHLKNSSNQGARYSGIYYDVVWNSAVSSIAGVENDDNLVYGGLTVSGKRLNFNPRSPDGVTISANSTVVFAMSFLVASDAPLTSSAVSSVTDIVCASNPTYGNYYSNGQATAEGQQQIIDSIEDQYDTESGQQEEITGDVNTVVSDIENIGLFSFLIDFSKQFVGVFSSGDDSTALTLPGFSITVDGQQLTVWEAQTFDFATMEGPFAVLLAAMRLGTSVVVIGALISYLFGLYEHIFAGSEQY